MTETAAKRPASFSLPAYRKVEEDLRARVRNGHWAPGAMLPGRKALATEYGVNLETVQRGIKELVDEGILIADSRRGTFVAGEAYSRETASATNVDSPRSATLTASGLGRRTSIIGLAGYVHITDDEWIASPVNSRCLDAMEDAAADLGFACRTINTCPTDTRPKTSLTEAAFQLAGSGVAAVVLMAGLGHPPSDLAELLQLDIPVVLVSADDARWPLTTVCYDHRDAGQLAARHLIDQSCSDLVFFSLSSDSWAIDRRTGAREALILSNRSPEQLRESFFPGPGTVPHSEFHAQAAAFAAEFIESGVPFDGVIAANDAMALGFMAAAAARGLESGRDYAIVGFDDLPRSRDVGLSSLKPPIEEMGREAINVMAAQLGGRQMSRRIVLHSKLIARDSSLLRR